MEMKLECALQCTPDRTVLEIFTGRRREDSIIGKRIVGHAYLPVGSDIYEIKLMMFPRHTYFMRKNRESIYRYTVFAKRFLQDGETKLTNPVGFGRLSLSLKNYVEIYFPLLGRLVFLDLIPKN